MDFARSRNDAAPASDWMIADNDDYDAAPAAPARALSSVTPSVKVAPAAPHDSYRAFVIAAIVTGITDGHAGGTFGGGSAAGAFVVGGSGDSVVLRANATRAQTIATVHAFVTDAPAFGNECGVGYWRDPATGRVWLDRITFHATRDEAITVGRARGERAVWDGVNRRTLAIGPAPFDAMDTDEDETYLADRAAFDAR